MTSENSLPRQYSRTLRFTLGAPRSFGIAPDGCRIAFLRSAGGAERANLLQVLDLQQGAAPSERVVADPAVLLGAGEEQLTPEERARRERSRESSAGIVAYATDAEVSLAAFALSGRLFLADLTRPNATPDVDDPAEAGSLEAGSLESGKPAGVRELPADGPVIDPRPSPDGSRIAYATAAGELRVIAADGTGDHALAGPSGAEDGEVTWGQAEFIAQEEMDRSRGYWWAPAGDRLLAARVDNSPVQRWWIADPANPDRPATEIAYPRAGSANAEVTLFVLSLDGTRVEVHWDRAAFPYLARVHWSAGGPPLLLVQARDQRCQLILALEPATGATTVVHTEQAAADAGEGSAWVEPHAGVPAWTPDGRLVRIADRDGARVLVVGDQVLTTPSLHLRAVLEVGEQDVLISASAGEAADDPEIGEVHVHRVAHGVDQGTEGPAVQRVDVEPGHHSAVRSGAVTVLVSAVLDRPGATVRVLRDGAEPVPVSSGADTPVLTARPVLALAGKSRIPTALLLPTGYDRARDGLLPVLMNPYGGPHGQMVIAAQNAHLTSQWFADQGFAVVVADGRGTPGRSPAWEQSVAFDLARVTLDDQVEALHALAQEHPLDLSRVGIRGWSYGGYLAALAVLRRPDVFHAAVAGAPVTDWGLYDTHYTERYLGHPEQRPEVYADNSLIAEAPKLCRPLQLIHGLADDNVVVAHTLRLSSALLAAGRPHELLPLSGVTHMTPQEEVAENLLLLQVDFLTRSLAR